MKVMVNFTMHCPRGTFNPYNNMRQPKEILKYGPQIITFHNATPPVYTIVGNTTWGSTGMRQTGSYTAVWGTPTSESWTTGTKDITGVEVIYSTLTTASVIQVSLQNVTMSAGGVRTPDGVILAVWSGSSSFGRVGELVTHSFASPYVISTGSVIATVLEYLDRGPSLPQLGFRGLVTYSPLSEEFGASIKSSTASAWAPTGDYFAPIRFICSDGSKLYYRNGYVGMTSASTSATNYGPTTTGTGIDSGDERGMLWIPKKTYDIVEARLGVRLTDATTQADIALYKDTTLLASQSYTNSENIATGNRAAYGIKLNTPIRVYPGDNIRLTTKPRASTVRWDRLSFMTNEDMIDFFGNSQYETNLSITNRVDEGAWNTPVSASSSYTPIQFYGYEVTGAELLSGSYAVSGSVVVDNTPVQNATVRVMRNSDNLTTSASTDVNGIYQFNLASGSYHVVAEYEFGGQKYNALSFWNVPSV